jgi:undecaprenyl-diphosphatase
MKALDHRITERLRAYGVSYLPFWKWVAAKGMWLFVIVWIGVVVLGLMAWWRPFVPLVFSYLTLLLVQAMVKRERPNFEKISGYKMWIRTYSFPSGHATESAALATALALYPAYPSALLAAGVICVLALLALGVMYSRLAVGVHYVTDVLVGCVLGTVYAIAFLY